MWRSNAGRAARPCRTGRSRLRGRRPAATLTHRHPTSDSASGFLAALVRWLVDGESLTGAVDAAREQLVAWDGHEETLDAVDTAIRLAGGGLDDYPAIGRIGHVGHETEDGHGKGWVAEEALGIALFCALRHQDELTRWLDAVDAEGSVTG